MQVFNYGENENAPIRVQVINGTACFVAKDVCRTLGISKYRDAMMLLDDDERASVLVDTLGGAQKMAAVNESGLYSLAFQSRKPGAKKFRKWVTMEVLPSIRKTGGYQVKVRRKRLPMLKDRSEELGAFFSELPKWVTLEDEKEVSRVLEVSRRHVHEVLMGRGQGHVVLAALVHHGMENRRAGIRRPDLSAARAEEKVRQLVLDFNNANKED